MMTPVRARSAAWLLVAALLAGSLVAYDSGTALLAFGIGAVVVAGVEQRTMTRPVATLAGVLLLSSLPWAMTLAT